MDLALENSESFISTLAEARMFYSVTDYYESRCHSVWFCFVFVFSEIEALRTILHCTLRTVIHISVPVLVQYQKQIPKGHQVLQKKKSSQKVTRYIIYHIL